MNSENNLVNQLVEDVSAIQGVESIMLGGSRADGQHKSHSDYDLYLYSYKTISPPQRDKILHRHCQKHELDNQFWEPEDDGVLTDGSKINLIYRNLATFDTQLSKVVFDHQASLGYTTCLWYNLLKSKIYFDKNGQAEKLQKKYSLSYPPELINSIISLNHPVLGSIQDSYLNQIRSAIAINDLISINHRLTAFLASYFDILFAVNKLPHLGEKRILTNLHNHAPKKPNNFSQNINALLRLSGNCDVAIINQLQSIENDLDQLLINEKLI